MNYRSAPGLLSKRKPIEYTLRGKVLQVICQEYNVTMDSLQSKCRKRDIVEPRQVACYLLRKYAHMTSTAIAKEFLRDHTTVLIAEQAVKAHMAFEDSYRERVLMIVQKIFS